MCLCACMRPVTMTFPFTIGMAFTLIWVYKWPYVSYYYVPLGIIHQLTIQNPAYIYFVRFIVSFIMLLLYIMMVLYIAHNILCWKYAFSGCVCQLWSGHFTCSHRLYVWTQQGHRGPAPTRQSRYQSKLGESESESPHLLFILLKSILFSVFW